MSFVEKTLLCIDCNKNFTYTAVDQAFHAAEGFPNNPGRCPLCRQARKTYRAPDETSIRTAVHSYNYFR